MANNRIIYGKNQDAVRKHFEENLLFTKFFWMNTKNLSLHMGFWDKNTKNLNDALMNENKYVAEQLDIRDNDRILDVGCGVGGTAIWIAENYGVKVVGIDLVPSNIKMANLFAKKRKVDHLVSFRLQNSSDLDPKSDIFNKIYAIESFCYMENKPFFIKQMFMHLEKGGKFVIADYFKGEKLGYDNVNLLNRWCGEWVIPNLIDFRSMSQELIKNGFKDLGFQDKTKTMVNSSRKLRRKTLLIFPIVKALHAMRLISGYPDKDIIIKEPNMFKSGVVKYASFWVSR
jgi:tocopherol O-methyltransferase